MIEKGVASLFEVVETGGVKGWADGSGPGLEFSAEGFDGASGIEVGAEERG